MLSAMRGTVAIACALVLAGVARPAGQGQEAERPRLSVKPTADFEVTAAGDAAAWRAAEWTTVPRRGPANHDYQTRFKSAYSPTGIYFLIEGTDRTLGASMSEDFMDLWNEDVFEVFLWTDERYPVYFEYEISPLERELPILVPNFGGQFLGWRPWHYDGERHTRKAVAILAGPKKTGAAIEGWRAEFFIPYALLRPLQNVPPKAGTRWRANVYRMDYDGGKRSSWQWSPVTKTFHEFAKFGELIFAER